MKKQVDLKFRLMLQANVSYLVRALAMAFLIFTLSLIVFTTFTMTYLHTTLGIIVGLICIGCLIFSSNLILYILNLSFRTGTVVMMDRRGFLDYASPIQWGLLSIQDIQYIKFSYSLLGDFLKVRMKRPLPVSSLSGLSRWNAKVMGLFDPNSVYIPLEVLDVTRMNLETQLLHFGALMRFSEEDRLDNSRTLLELMVEKYEKGSSKEPEKVPSETESEQEAEEGAEVELSELTRTSYMMIDQEEFEAPPDLSFYQTNTSHTFVPPKLDPSASEKSKVIQHISALKNYVKKKDLDSKICEIYTDFVSQFPHWEESGDLRLPKEIHKARLLDNQSDYEEVQFHYKDYLFNFSLRKDIGSSDMALLSVGFQGRVKMSIRVSVEIGALDPKDLEVFHRDHWEKYFDEVYKLCMKGGFGHPLGGLEEETCTTIEMDLDKLKNNFSSGEES